MEAGTNEFGLCKKGIECVSESDELQNYQRSQKIVIDLQGPRATNDCPGCSLGDYGADTKSSQIVVRLSLPFSPPRQIEMHVPFLLRFYHLPRVLERHLLF